MGRRALGIGYLSLFYTFSFIYFFHSFLFERGEKKGSLSNPQLLKIWAVKLFQFARSRITLTPVEFLHHQSYYYLGKKKILLSGAAPVRHCLSFSFGTGLIHPTFTALKFCFRQNFSLNQDHPAWEEWVPGRPEVWQTLSDSPEYYPRKSELLNRNAFIFITSYWWKTLRRKVICHG